MRAGGQEQGMRHNHGRGLGLCVWDLLVLSGLVSGVGAAVGCGCKAQA